MRDSRVTAAATTDARLVRRLLERDPTALGEFCSLYCGRLYALGYRLAGSHDAAVAFAVETITRAFRGLEEIAREQLELLVYLRVTARSVFLEQAGNEVDPAHATRDAARIANAALPPAQRLVLALRELEQLSYAEIASLVELSESDVARAIADSRERLRVQLGIGEARRPDLRALCRMMVPLLSAHVDGETRDMRLEDVTGHLADCERCRSELVGLQEVQQRYRRLVPPAPDEELRNRVETGLVAAGLWGDRPAPRRSRKRFPLAAVALAALAGTGIAASLLVPSNPARRVEVSAPPPPLPTLIPSPPTPAQHTKGVRATPKHPAARSRPGRSRPASRPAVRVEPAQPSPPRTTPSTPVATRTRSAPAPPPAPGHGHVPPAPPAPPPPPPAPTPPPTTPPPPAPTPPPSSPPPPSPPPPSPPPPPPHPPPPPPPPPPQPPPPPPPPPPPRKPSSLSLSCSVLPFGASESGTLSPPLGGESISIVYTPSSGDAVTHVETTAGDGTYEDSFRPTGKGPWHVQAHWAGNDQYLPADSGVCTLGG